jgi:hypothetical protein
LLSILKQQWKPVYYPIGDIQNIKGIVVLVGSGDSYNHWTDQNLFPFAISQIADDSGKFDSGQSCRHTDINPKSCWNEPN